MSTSQATPGAQSIERALGILELFSLDSPSHTATEIAKLASLTTSTTHRVLKAMVNRNFLAVDEQTREYRLGPSIARLAAVVANSDGLSVTAAPLLRSLQAQTGEAVSLQVPVGLTRLCVVEYESSHNLQYKSGVGRTYPLVAGSAGKAIVAHFEDAEIERIIRETQRTGILSQAPTIREYMAECEVIRQAGFATSSGEIMEGGAGAAAAILDISGYPIASINIGGPQKRLNKSALRDAGAAALQAALAVERQMSLPPRSERRRSHSTSM